MSEQHESKTCLKTSRKRVGISPYSCYVIDPGFHMPATVANILTSFDNKLRLNSTLDSTFISRFYEGRDCLEGFAPFATKLNVLQLNVSI